MMMMAHNLPRTNFPRENTASHSPHIHKHHRPSTTTTIRSHCVRVFSVVLFIIYSHNGYDVYDEKKPVFFKNRNNKDTVCGWRPPDEVEQKKQLSKISKMRSR